MIYKNGQTGLTISNEDDKKLIMDIISTFLETHNDIETAKKTDATENVVNAILENRRLILNLCGENVFENIKTIRKRNKQTMQELEYEKMMNEILFYMINSLYSYDEIGEKIYITKYVLEDMINNEEYIKEHFGNQMLEKLKQFRDIRRKLPSIKRTSLNRAEILKNPKYRRLVKPDVIVVSDYEHALIKKVALFLDYNGNSQEAVMNSKYTINEFITSLNDIKLKDLLLENVFETMQKLLEIDSILIQNRTQECNELIKTVVTIAILEDGNLEKIKNDLGYSEAVIRRILSHPYASIYCHRNNIEVPVLKISEDEAEVIKEKTL